MNNFRRLDGESLLLKVQGSLIDIASLSTVFDSLQSITDVIVTQKLSSSSDKESLLSPKQLAPGRPIQVYRPGAVRLMVSSASSGSLRCVLDYYISAVLADPNINAILLNLAADMIFAFASSGVRGITARIHPHYVLARQAMQAKQDPYHVRDPILKMIEAIDANESIDELELSVTSAGDVKLSIRRDKIRSKKGW